MRNIRVSAYVDTREQSRFAQGVLSAIDPASVIVYDGLVEGIADESALAKLHEHGLMIDATEEIAPEEEDAAEPGLAPERAEMIHPLKLESVAYWSSGTSPDIHIGTAAALSAPTTQSEAACHVRLRQPTSAEIRQELKDHGIDICGFEPPLSYSMVLTPEQVAFLRSRPWVDRVIPHQPGDKVRNDVFATIFESGTPAFVGDKDSMTEAPQFDILLYRPGDLEKIKGMLADTPGVEVIDAVGRMIRVKIADDVYLLELVGRQTEVERIIPYTAPSLYADFSRQLVGIDIVSGAPGGWDGSGQIVGIFDSGIDADHPDFQGQIHYKGKVGGAIDDDVIGHGTHVAGIIAGTGAASGGRIKGIAPGAKLIVYSIANADRKLQLGVDLGQLLQKAVDRGARIINLSWGTAISGEYNFGSMSVDRFVYENPNVLVVVAAGNDGKLVNGDISFRDVGSPATARNVVTVGACGTNRNSFTTTWGQFRPSKFSIPPINAVTVAGNPEVVAPISSRGPTETDGVKPDVVAPGTCIASTRSSKVPQLNTLFWNAFDLTKDPNYTGVSNLDRYVFLGGTSMAAPVVSGTAAVLRQYLTEERQVAEPSAALLKALLIASACRVPTTPRNKAPAIGYPDFDQGFGRIDVRGVLPHPGAPPLRNLAFVDVPNDSNEALESRALVGAPRKSFRTYLVNVTDTSLPLRVVLNWTDYFGNNLQNDLQLDVRSANGTALVGNHELKFLADPLFVPSAFQASPFDKRNNVEVVFLENPPIGGFRIRVVAHNTPFPNQGYALVVVGALASDVLALAPTF